MDSQGPMTDEVCFFSTFPFRGLLKRCLGCWTGGVGERTMGLWKDTEIRSDLGRLYLLWV